MKLLWVYDHYFCRKASGQVYSRAHFTQEIWDRYLIHTNELVVASRERKMRPSESDKNLVRSDRPEISFVFLPNLTNPFTRIKASRDCRRTLFETIKNVDGVIARLPSENGRLAIEIAQQFDKPFAVEVVGCAWDGYWNYGNLTGKLFAPYAKRAMAKAVASSRFAIYVTEQFLQERYPCEGTTASASNVELPELHNSTLEKRLARIESAHQPFKIGLIGYVGSKIKGIHIALKALEVNVDNLPPFVFEILGGGDQSTWINMAKDYGLADKVVFKGLVPSGKPVHNWLDTVDFYIQPSFQEGLPRATVEALARACPALGSTAGGIGELLPVDCLHTPGDHKELGRQLVRYANDKEWLIMAAKRNFQKAQNYQKSRLDRIRSDFFDSFIKSILHR